jgi:hypothetical protein
MVEKHCGRAVSTRERAEQQVDETGSLCLDRRGHFETPFHTPVKVA